MAYIYKITNLLNEKCYIGKTEYNNPKRRFFEHLRDKDRYSERPLYRAINKHGIKCFSFEVIEKTDFPEEREIYWIQFYNSYGKDGYNATLGGDGVKYLNQEKIIEDYKILKDTVATAKKNDCCKESVRQILRNNDVEILSHTIAERVTYGKKVLMLDKETKEELMVFDSQQDAAKFLIENGFSNVNAENFASLASKISLVCRNKRKTCAGFGWKRLE